jgi:hypothetical protein
MKKGVLPIYGMNSKTVGAFGKMAVFLGGAFESVVVWRLCVVLTGVYSIGSICF